MKQENTQSSIRPASSVRGGWRARREERFAQKRAKGGLHTTGAHLQIAQLTSSTAASISLNWCARIAPTCRVAGSSELLTATLPPPRPRPTDTPTATYISCEVGVGRRQRVSLLSSCRSRARVFLSSTNN